METVFSDFMNMAWGTVTVQKVLSAIAVLVICLVAIRLILRVARRLLAHCRLQEQVQRYLLLGIKAILYILTVIIVATSLGFDMTSLVALLSVGSLGITLAAEDVLGNMAGGLVILSSQPFAVGDFVEINGVCGTVQEIRLNHTRVLTNDGKVVLLPNQELASSVIINYSTLGRRRVEQSVQVAYDSDPEAVKRACYQAVASTKGVLQDPAPAVYITKYAESAIEYTTYCWAATEDYWTVYFGVGEALQGTLKANGVEMTYNHINVHMMKD